MIQTFIKSASPIVANSILTQFKSNSRKLYLLNHVRFTHNLFDKLRDLYFKTKINSRTIHYTNMSELKINDGDQRDKVSNDCMDSVFVQKNPDKDSITISFNLIYEGKSKRFNMIRKTSDPLSSAIERIKLNLVKMTKPKKVKKSTTVEEKCYHFEDVVLLLNNSPIDLDVKNIDAWVDGAIFRFHNKSYEVITNAPQVEFLKLPNCIMKNFVIIPTVSLVNCSIDNCKFQWYRQISAQEKENYIKDGVCMEDSITFDQRNYWYKICDGLIFCPKLEDVAHYIKVVCMPSDGVRDGPEISSISSTPVELGPSCCPFEKRHELTKLKISDPKKFRFMTYNILADLYADSDYSRSVLFGHCPSHALDIDYRRQLLLKEILGYNADIYCLQEVDKKEFEKTYQPFFGFIGNYSGIFDTKGGQVAEGEATFYHNDKFELIHSHKTLLSELIEEKSNFRVNVVESNEPLVQNETKTQSPTDCESKSSHFILESRDSPEAQKCLSKFDHIRKTILSKAELKKRFCERHTIIQTTLLKFKQSPNDHLLVANTHLYFAPDADHIRLLQGSICVKYLEYLKEYYMELLKTKMVDTNQTFLSPNIFTIFTGDMNSTPDCGLYKLLTQGKVNSSLSDWKSAGDDESVLDLDVSTDLRFSSAYENIDYTNYTPGFNGCLDYIYYELDYMNCESTVPLPDHKDVTAIGGIPSDVFPSDHLALIADIKLSSQ